MTQVPVDGAWRERMSYAEYEALPPSLRAEWVDGEVVVSPSPSWRHQQAARRLANLLEQALPGLTVVEAVTVRLATERVPDVVVLAEPPRGDHVDVIPLAVVEVVSPGNRSEDTVRKSTEYVRAGIGQYWLLDAAVPVLDVFSSGPAGWSLVARLDADEPVGTVDVLGRGQVHIDLTALLA